MKNEVGKVGLAASTVLTFMTIALCWLLIEVVGIARELDIYLVKDVHLGIPVLAISYMISILLPLGLLYRLVCHLEGEPGEGWELIQASFVFLFAGLIIEIFLRFAHP